MARWPVKMPLCQGSSHLGAIAALGMFALANEETRTAMRALCSPSGYVFS